MTDLQDAMTGADPLQCWEPAESQPEPMECGEPDPGWGEPDAGHGGHGHLELDIELEWDHGGDWGDLDL
ncbi:MAG: hypothetical protein IT196_14410 [Acidimicrobiales bacterium]|nr:hypothetical protein [Acidimicrobiales bacterium]